MGFIKWLLEQYRIYKAEKYLKPNREENDRQFMANYQQCLAEGFTASQINAILNLCCTYERAQKQKGE